LPLAADADYFLRVCGRVLKQGDAARIKKTMLAAYRWQYIGSGVRDERLQRILGGMITADQMKRIVAALAPMMD
jgi:hypothetical protein